jgi:hypothetical protein
VSQSVATMAVLGSMIDASLLIHNDDRGELEMESREIFEPEPAQWQG